jgi:hypothetical protein
VDVAGRAAGSPGGGFHRDVEAVVEYLLTSTQLIAELEAWLATWASKAVIDGYRRRRGETGALQRPRMTEAMSAALGHDPWLCKLALNILTWVGVPAGLGATLWPLSAWAAERALVTGDHQRSTTRQVGADVESVLAVLRQRETWFARHVDMPLGA